MSIFVQNLCIKLWPDEQKHIQHKVLSLIPLHESHEPPSFYVLF